MKYILLSLIAVAAIALIHANVTAENWRTASREPVGLATNPATTPDAVIQVYAARAVRWRTRVCTATCERWQRTTLGKPVLAEASDPRSKRRFRSDAEASLSGSPR